MRPRERCGPVLHRQCGAGRPFRAHADAEQRAEQEEKHEGRRKAGDEVRERVPEDRNHQRDLAPDPVGEPARAATAPTSRIHKVTVSTNATSVSGT